MEEHDLHGKPYLQNVLIPRISESDTEGMTTKITILYLPQTKLLLSHLRGMGA